MCVTNPFCQRKLVLNSLEVVIVLDNSISKLDGPAGSTFEDLLHEQRLQHGIKFFSHVF
jgi:hypothetical protein